MFQVKSIYEQSVTGYTASLTWTLSGTPASYYNSLSPVSISISSQDFSFNPIGLTPRLISLQQNIL